MTTTTRASDKMLTEYVCDFDGVRDRFGRQIGVEVAIHAIEYVEIEPIYGQSFYSVEPGIWYTLWVSQTRNGKFYGAAQNGRRFATYDEALIKAEELVAKRRKEYTKKYCQQ